jgi:hypothetical protein
MLVDHYISDGDVICVDKLTGGLIEQVSQCNSDKCPPFAPLFGYCYSSQQEAQEYA